MKTNQKKKRITMIVLREADKPVQRSRFSRTSLYLVFGTLLAVIALVTGWQYTMHQQSFETIHTLSAQLAEHDDVYHDMISSKETVIEDLKTNIVELTEKTTTLRSQFNDLERLKDEVLSLLDEVNEASTTAISDTVTTLTAQTHHSDQAIGGEVLRPSARQWDDFIALSYAEMSALTNDMLVIATQLTQTKNGLADLLHNLKMTPDYWPTSSRTLTSSYGIRKDPFTGSASFHSGIDIAGNVLDPVFAAADGRVIEAGSDKAKGNYIRIRHSSQLETVYMHLHTILIEQGDAVTKGQQIAALGNTGRSTGPHLHFEVLQSNEYVNPFDYLQ